MTRILADVEKPAPALMSSEKERRRDDGPWRRAFRFGAGTCPKGAFAIHEPGTSSMAGRGHGARSGPVPGLCFDNRGGAPWDKGGIL